MKITIKNLQKKIRIPPERVKKLISKTISASGGNKPGRICVCLVSDKEIRGLNRRFLNKNTATDVLAFDLSGAPGSRRPGDLCADIAVSTETAARNARAFNTSVSYETHLYIVHGVLHILGYDDRTPRQKRAMQRRAAGILCALRIRP